MYAGVLGYADDTLALSPSREGLQEMMATFQDYAMSHNLKFSTHEDPKKSKTKCLAFLKQERPLKKIVLDGNELPWVDHGKHVGHTIENELNGMKKDIGMKKGMYIQRNCELSQEFHFCHPMSKYKINQIYNSSFTGSPLWDLFSDSSKSLEKTFNISVRKMFDLPKETHCYLLEPITERKHLKFVLLKRLINFKKQVMNCDKNLLKTMFQICEHDSRSITGSNLRKLMLLCDKSSISDIHSSDIDILSYREIPQEEAWRIETIKELIEIKTDPDNLLPNFPKEEIEEILSLLCVS